MHCCVVAVLPPGLLLCRHILPHAVGPSSSRIPKFDDQQMDHVVSNLSVSKLTHRQCLFVFLSIFFSAFTVASLMGCSSYAL